MKETNFYIDMTQAKARLLVVTNKSMNCKIINTMVHNWSDEQNFLWKAREIFHVSCQ